MSDHKTLETLDDTHFILRHVGDYLDETLDGAPKSRYEKLLNQEEYKTLMQKFQRALGRLQMALQELTLDEDVVARMRSFVLDPNIAESEIAHDLDKMTLLERILNLKNRLIILAIFFLGFWGLISILDKKDVEKLDVLSTLNFETLAMESGDDTRLDLPSHDWDEVHAYFSAYKGLGFKPNLFKNIPQNWNVDGASIIRYDRIANVAVVKFSNKADKKMFLYSLAGTMADLPRAEQRVVPGKTFTYQAYTSDDFNFIAWPSADNRLSLLVGRLSGDDLAQIASDYRN